MSIHREEDSSLLIGRFFSLSRQRFLSMGCQWSIENLYSTFFMNFIDRGRTQDQFQVAQTR